MLSENAIKDFQAAYRKEFGTDISHQEAQAMGIRLLHLFALILQPVPKKLVKEKLKEAKEVIKNDYK